LSGSGGAEAAGCVEWRIWVYQAPHEPRGDPDVYGDTPTAQLALYGILPGLALTVLLMARILGEEAMLNRDLEGYIEYTKNVHYRLFPLIW
jgi:hypothetical protein